MNISEMQLKYNHELQGIVYDELNKINKTNEQKRINDLNQIMKHEYLRNKNLENQTIKMQVQNQILKRELNKKLSREKDMESNR